MSRCRSINHFRKGITVCQITGVKAYLNNPHMGFLYLEAFTVLAGGFLTRMLYMAPRVHAYILLTNLCLRYACYVYMYGMIMHAFTF